MIWVEKYSFYIFDELHDNFKRTPINQWSRIIIITPIESSCEAYGNVNKNQFLDFQVFIFEVNEITRNSMMRRSMN
jgi:hypothetical protein